MNLSFSFVSGSSEFHFVLFYLGMPKMRKKLMTKRRLDGSTFTEMYFVIQSTNLYLLQPLVLALSCLHCKDLFNVNLRIIGFAFLQNSFNLYPILLMLRTVFIFMLALVGVFYPYNRGALFTALVVIYALTSGIAGYTATSFYCQLEGPNWVFDSILLV